MEGADSRPAAGTAHRLMLGGWPHFLAGVFLTLLGVGAAIALLVSRGAPPAMWTTLGRAEPPIALPPDVLADLTRAGVIGDNFSGLNSTAEHDNFFVQPDDWLTYKLRPNVRVEVVVPPAKGEFNLDPPTLNIPDGAQLADATRAYLSLARLRVAYTTDADGRRLTTPVTSAPRKVLIVGDSVGFGLGVDDQDTVASQLQQLLGPGIQVVNAAVGGYTGEQAVRMADVVSRSRAYEAVIYIACENDFDPDSDPPDADGAGRQSLTSVREIVAGFMGIAGRFEAGVTVLLTTRLEYEAQDVLLAAGADRPALDHTSRIKTDLARESAAAGFRFAGWSDIVADHRQAAKSVLAPFALYVDHTHLSRAGNGLLAEKLVSLLGRELAEAAQPEN
jgi:lysophospholipase L1-like esterase